jgi:OmpA-OmpF porin, OOP family
MRVFRNKYSTFVKSPELMKKIGILAAAVMCAVSTLKVSAQDSTLITLPVEVKLNPMAKPEWIFGIHGVVADDDGRSFKGLFDVSGGWNFNPYPSRITAERTIIKDWRVEAAVSYIKYKAGKIVNDNPIMDPKPFVAIDLNAKYDLNGLIGDTDIFDPYTVSGLGFTHRGAILKSNAATINLGLGCNIWIYEGFGLNLQTTAKLKILPGTSNYLMHSVGIVYRLNHVENAEPRDGSIRDPR